MNAERVAKSPRAIGTKLEPTMFDRGVPSICYGLRGLVYCQIDLRGSKTDLHSGSFGGAVGSLVFPAQCEAGGIKAARVFGSVKRNAC